MESGYFTLIQGEDFEISVSKQVNIWLTEEEDKIFNSYPIKKSKMRIPEKS